MVRPQFFKIVTLLDNSPLHNSLFCGGGGGGEEEDREGGRGRGG